MKCLIVTDVGTPEGTQATAPVQIMQAQLAAHGISYARMFSDAAGSATYLTAAYAATFDFILIPQIHTTTWANLINRTDITIPIIVMDMSSNANTNTLGATPGATGTMGGLSAYYFLDTDISSTKFLASNVRDGCAISSTGGSTGVAIQSISAINPLTGGAQTNAGSVVMWKVLRGTAHTGWMYVSLHNAIAIPQLSYLLQRMYNDGVFTSTQMLTLKKAPVFMAFDHINGPEFNQTYATDKATETVSANLERFLAYIPTGKYIWAGVTDGNSLYLSNMSADQVTIYTRESGKKLRYCYHNHSTPNINDAITNGTVFPNCVNTMTKAQESAQYTTDLGLWAANGLTFHIPGYYDPGGNQWNDGTLQLFSGDTSKDADPAGTASTTGKGFKVFRMSNTSTERAYPVVMKDNCYHKQSFMQGIQLVSTGDLSLAANKPNNTAALIAQPYQQILKGISLGFHYYIHDEQFVTSLQVIDTTTNTYTAKANGVLGWHVMELIKSMAAYHKDVANFWADPLEYWSGRTVHIG